MIARDMWVFRDGRATLPGRDLLQQLAEMLAAPGFLQNPDRLLDAFIRAGELECALADANSPFLTRLAQITDSLAAAVLQPARAPALSERAAAILAAVSDPGEVQISVAEGFSYYALHPLSYAKLVHAVRLDGASAAVIGIRSIGTTLSAVVAAALAQRKVRAERITVRPGGHPFHRRSEFSSGQVQWVRRHIAEKSLFFVVDEGPGISGSSFLSVGEALVEAGVPRQRIAFLCSHQPDAEKLAAQDAAARWRAFTHFAVPDVARQGAAGDKYLAGGEWRRHLLPKQADWPACWPQMERSKFLSADGNRFIKFEGLGRYGEEAMQRSRVAAAAGFTLPAMDFDSGFAEYPLIPGRILRASDLATAVLDRLADYCAFREREFRVKGPAPSQLGEMLRVNVATAFGTELAPASLPISNAVVTDSRMLPHEWLLAEDGRLLKTDAISHGDDHFFPGPTDIAWDIAGAIIEWEMPPEAAYYFLRRYRIRSDDDAQPRLDPFVLAYTVFRMGYCKMALAAATGSDEVARLVRAYCRYRGLAEQRLAGMGFKVRPRPISPILQLATQSSLSAAAAAPPCHEPAPLTSS